MSPEKQLVTRYYQEVLNGRDLDVLEELLTPDFVSNLPEDGWTRHGLGPREFREAVTASHQAFPDLSVAVLDQVAEGDRVATRFSARGTHQGPFAGIPPTGRPVEVTAIHLHRVAGGRIAEHWEAINLLDALRTLGAFGTA